MTGISAESEGSSFLSRVAHLFAARAGMYCISALIAGVFGVLLLTAVTLSMFHNQTSGPFDPVLLWRSMTVGGKLITVFGLLFGLWTPIFIAARAACRITADQLAGRPLSAAQLLADMIKFLPAALVYTLIVGLATMISSAMLYIPGLAIAALFVLVVPTGVNEPAGMFATLGRGVSLAMKVYGRAFLFTLASCIVMIIVAALRIVGLDRFISGSPATTVAIRFAVMYIPGLLLLILANICFALLYLDARTAETQHAGAGPASPGSPQ